jgi:hypothetical protein
LHRETTTSSVLKRFKQIKAVMGMEKKRSYNLQLRIFTFAALGAACIGAYGFYVERQNDTVASAESIKAAYQECSWVEAAVITQKHPMTVGELKRVVESCEKFKKDRGATEQQKAVFQGVGQ